MRALFAILVLSLSVSLAMATTNVASSCSEAAIRTALIGLTDGDSIVIPQGAGNVTNTIFVLHNINIYGAGIGKSILYDTVVQQGVNPRTLAVLDIEATNAKPFRVTGLEIDIATNGYARSSPNQNGTVQINGNCKAIRFDHNSSYHLNGRPLVVQGCWGLVDHNTFEMFNQQAMFVGAKYMNGPADAYGDYSWTIPTAWGTTNGLYVEDCFFKDDYIKAGKNALDSQFGAVWVFRNNICINMNTGCHGTETGGRADGNKSFEEYSNSFDGLNLGLTTAVDVRSGTGISFGNLVTNGYNHAVRLEVNRSTDSFNPWGGANGTNPYDNNDPHGVFASGTHTGTNNADTLMDTNATWTLNQWYAYTVVNTNTSLFSAIVSNSTTTISYLGAKANLGISNPLVWTNGQHYLIYRVNDVLDQPGRGYRLVLMSNSVPSPVAWPSNTMAPLYSWNQSLGPGTDEIYSAFPHAQLNREFFVSTPMPGYTPLQYPHPLQNAGNPPFPVDIIGQPSGGGFAVATTVTLQVVASGTSPTYQWFKDGASITAATNSSYSLPGIAQFWWTPTDQYSVTVSGPTNSVNSQTVSVQVVDRSMGSLNYGGLVTGLLTK